eukprot:2865305-Prorocentrum_lima.AAC.1
MRRPDATSGLGAPLLTSKLPDGAGYIAPSSELAAAPPALTGCRMNYTSTARGWSPPSLHH